jgi:hypothetical protein
LEKRAPDATAAQDRAIGWPDWLGAVNLTASVAELAAAVTTAVEAIVAGSGAGGDADDDR